MTFPGIDDSTLCFVPLGGSGEIGMNLNLYGIGGKWLMVDLGVTFGDYRLPGIDIVMPDIRFIEERKNDLVGLVLTHAHEDHFGAVAHLWPRLKCPVYATPFTAELLRGKLIEADLLDQVPLFEVPLGGRIDLPPFDLGFITLTHSIPEPNALSIRTAAGTVLHTGDWKIDPDPQLGEVTDHQALSALGDDGVLAMICDSTNVLEDGESGSEAGVRAALTEVVGKCRGRVAVTAFASNVARLASIIAAATAAGRQPVLVGRSIKRAITAARAAGYLADVPGLRDESDCAGLAAGECLYICTGSQGESRGAMARIASGEHREVRLDAGDTVIFSSRRIPGNDLTIHALYNTLAARGITVITDSEAPVHVSGHPCRDELAKMYQWVRPHIAIPVHGEPRHLAEHGEFATLMQVPHCLVPENGSIIALDEDGPRLIGKAPAGRLVIDGDQLVDAEGPSVVGRRRLLHNGQASVSLVVNGDGGLLDRPRVSLLGVPWEGDQADLVDLVAEAVITAHDRLSRRQRDNDDILAEAMRIAARRALRQSCAKKPLTVVHVHRIGARP